jgi:hypothetical protein
LLELVQQNRLSDASKTGQHQTATVPTSEKALERDVHRLDLAVPPDERRRASPGSRTVRIAHRVHSAKYRVFLHL